MFFNKTNEEKMLPNVVSAIIMKNAMYNAKKNNYKGKAN